jgi:O-methyltransferase domain
MVRDGKQNAFVREFGHMAFEHAAEDSEYAAVFNEAMSSYSAGQSALALEALADYDFGSVAHVCDVGGGHGHLLCSFLAKYPHAILHLGVSGQAAEKHCMDGGEAMAC